LKNLLACASVPPKVEYSLITLDDPFVVWSKGSALAEANIEQVEGERAMYGTRLAVTLCIRTAQ
jgi:hypothetical protein